MLVLLDESLPRQLARELDGFEVKTVAQMGWAGVKNGKLLNLALESKFSIFLTADQNLQYQQNISASGIAVIVIKVFSTRIENILPLVPQIRREIIRIKSGQLVRVGGT